MILICILSLDVKNFQTIDATPAMVTQDFTYLKKSHKSLLMFRRTSKDDGKLELRHQRTGDVVFDWHGKFYYQIHPNILCCYRLRQASVKA